MIRDLADSLKLTMYERVTSPMAGVFLLSWLTFNWKAPLILIWGEAPIKDRIDFISTNYLVDQNTYIYYPLYSTIVILILYPMISLGPFYWWHWSSALKTKLRQKIDGGILLTKEQSTEIMNKIFHTKEEHRKEIESHIQESDYLRERIKSLQDNESFIKDSLDKATVSSSSLEKQLDSINNSDDLKKYTRSRLVTALNQIKEGL